MDRKTHYRSTQVGWVVLISLGVALAIMAPLLWTQAGGAICTIAVAILLFVAALFGALTVTVDSKRVAARFGIGLIRRSVAFHQLKSFRTVRNQWYYGWGIRIIPGGWMFNVSGLSAVELCFQDGHRFRIGTADARGLCEAIRQSMGEPEELSPTEWKHPTAGPRPRKVILAVLTIVGLVFGGVGYMLYGQYQPPEITVGSAELSVAGFIYHDKVSDADIQSVTLLDKLPAISARTNGFAFGGRLRGNFKLKDGRKARLYVDAKAPPFIEVRHEDGLLIFNDEEPRRTRELYESLRGDE